MIMSWLKILSIELSSIDAKEFIEPNTEVDLRSDVVVGDADDELKRVYALTEKLQEAAARYSIDARFSKDNRLRSDAEKKAYELRKKVEILMEIFWITLKDKFDLWDKNSVGIRKGWKVVYSKENLPRTFLDILKNL